MESQADEKLQVGAGQSCVTRSPLHFKLRSGRNLDVQVAAYGSHCCVHLIHSRVVVNVQYPIHLRQVPAEAARQLCLADALLPHPLIKHHLDGGERRQHSHLPSL